MKKSKMIIDLLIWFFCYLQLLSSFSLSFNNFTKNLIKFCSYFSRWKKKLRKVEEILLTGLPIQEQIERESIFCDYLPMIRSISRSECVRLAGNSKRSNRFFNYLSSLNMHPDESQRTLMCNSFVVMNETKSSSWGILIQIRIPSRI